MNSNQHHSLEVCLLCFTWHGVVAFFEICTDSHCSGTCSEVFLPQTVRNRISCESAAFLPNRALKCSTQCLDSGILNVLTTLVFYLGLRTNWLWSKGTWYLVLPSTSWFTVDLLVTFSNFCMNIFLTRHNSSCNIIFSFKKVLLFIFKKLSLSSSQVALAVFFF